MFPFDGVIMEIFEPAVTWSLETYYTHTQVMTQPWNDVALGKIYFIFYVLLLFGRTEMPQIMPRTKRALDYGEVQQLSIGIY